MHQHHSDRTARMPEPVNQIQNYRIFDRRLLDHLRAAPRTDQRINLPDALDQLPHVADATGRRAGVVKFGGSCGRVDG